MARANIFGRHHPARSLARARGHTATRYDGTSDGGFTVAEGSLRLSVAGCIPEVEKCDFSSTWGGTIFKFIYTVRFIRLKHLGSARALFHQHFLSII